MAKYARKISKRDEELKAPSVRYSLATLHRFAWLAGTVIRLCVCFLRVCGTKFVPLSVNRALKGAKGSGNAIRKTGGTADVQRVCFLRGTDEPWYLNATVQFVGSNLPFLFRILGHQASLQDFSVRTYLQKPEGRSLGSMAQP